MHSAFNRCLSILAGLLLALVLAQPAVAHAQLLGTAPAQNAVLMTQPEMVQLSFNEPVTALAVSLVAPDGTRTDLLSAATSGDAVTVALPPGRGRGSHLLSWRVVSVDGHPIGGSLIFSIGAVTGAVEIAATDPAVAGLLWAAKLALFAALAFGVGGAVFALVAPLPATARKFAAALSLIGVLAAPLSLGLHGLDALGLGVAEFATPSAWSVALDTSYGATVLIAIAGLASALAALLSRPLAWAAWPAWLLGALALALSGHAATAEPQWLTRPSVMLHFAGILFWVGALVPLLMHLRDASTAADHALRRFSAIVPYAVAPTVISGIVLAAVQMGMPGPHWLTPYGAILGGKLGLLAGLFGLALWNRGWLTVRVRAGDPTSTRRMQLSIRTEIVLVLAILGLVAGWRFTPPPRALLEVAEVVQSEPLLLHLMRGDDMAMVTVDPGRTGVVTLDIALSDTAGVPIAADSVTATLSAPALGIEPFKAEATDLIGAWRIEGLAIPVAGTWQLDLDIRKSRFSLMRLSTQFDILSPDFERTTKMTVPRSLIAAGLAALLLAAPGIAQAQDAAAPVGDLAISGAFARATLPNAPVGGGFLTITNNGASDDRLVSVTSPAAADVQLHEMAMENDVMKMRKLADGIPVPAGATVTLQPGGLHLMFMKLAGPMVEGTSVPVTLTFEKAGTLTLELSVQGVAADAPPMDHGMHSDTKTTGN